MPKLMITEVSCTQPTERVEEMGAFDKLFRKKGNDSVEPQAVEPHTQDVAPVDDRSSATGESQGVVPFKDFTMALQHRDVEGLYRIALPVDWEPYESDRFRTKSRDGKTLLSITIWKVSDDLAITEQYIRDCMTSNFQDFVTEGGYEPYNDFISNDRYVSKSFKVDNETQYYLHVFHVTGFGKFRSGFIIRDIGDYNPQMRATLLNIVNTIQFLP